MSRAMAPPLPRPQPFPRPPAYAEVLNLHRGDDSAYMVHSDKYDGHGHFQLVIRPDPGDHFGFKVVLEPDFRFGPNNQYDRARVKVFVDGMFLRAQYFEAKSPGGARSLSIFTGRKRNLQTDETVEFECIIGDPRRPGSHPDSGTIIIELTLGRSTYKQKKIIRTNEVAETDTFKHGTETPVKPSLSKRSFKPADFRLITPLRWRFQYADKNPGTIYTDYNTEHGFAGLGKRDRDNDAEDLQDDYKRARLDGGLEYELLRCDESMRANRSEIIVKEQPHQKDLVTMRREPKELYPENNGVHYNLTPEGNGLQSNEMPDDSGVQANETPNDRDALYNETPFYGAFL